MNRNKKGEKWKKGKTVFKKGRMYKRILCRIIKN